MARIAWQFYDAVEATTEYLEINPNEGASPNYQKTLTKATTTAPGSAGQPLIFEGADQPSQFDFSGVILEQSQYELLETAWEKRHLLTITDDLGRSFTVYIESFSPQRELSRTHPWKHTYQMSTVVVSRA